MKLRMRLVALAALLTTVLATGGFSPARNLAPGDPSMLNLAHVYTFDTGGGPTDPTGKGTDVEFYTSTVPLRDYTTGELILDEEGNQILVDKDFAIMGSYGGGGWVFDITDPENVQFVRNIPCNQTQNDVQLKKFEERWILALARDGGSNPCNTGVPNKGSGGAGIAVFDVTDPYAFTRIYNFRNTGGAHNFTFHPTKPYGWVSTGDLPGALNHIPIINFTDVDNPTLAADIQVEGGPHDISFSADGLRAYVASENNARIYDVSNPAAPVLISRTPNAGTYSHGFDPTPDRSMAVVTNESLALGGFFAGGSTVCPGEGLTFFDIEGSNEATPIPVGEYLPTGFAGRAPDNRACTGHVGRIAPNSHVLSTGWYIGGVRVVDFANPSLPTEVAHAVMPGTEVWAAKMYKGPYIYSADMRRGFDVYKWSGTGTAPWVAP
ncbi:MAG TPA: hypothetical protein VGB28_06560 [Actinomycetota bacterium]|jgi:hypothetical protein